MAFGFTTYVDPGVYQQEVIVPNGINIPALPFAVCLIGTGSRFKRVTNEAVLRGLVKGESLTPAGSSPHLAVLANRASKKLETTTVYKTLNGIKQALPDNYVQLALQPYVLGTVTAATVDLSTNNAIALEMDGKDAVTIVLVDGAPGTTFIGRQISVSSALGGTNGDASTMAEIRDAINTGLAAASALGYGATYATVASVSEGALKITSPNSDSTADVRVFSPFATDAVAAIFGAPAAGNRDAQTYVQIADLAWNASATWSIDYVKVTGDTDALVQTSNVQTIVRVGKSPGATNFNQLVDWKLTTNEVDWSPDAAATVTGSVSETFDVSGAHDQLVVQVDDEAAVTIDLVGLSSAPIGYVANPGGTLGSAATAANIVTNINSVLAAQLGPRYKAVASVADTTKVKLTSPIEGSEVSFVSVAAHATSAAYTRIFGGAVSDQGEGKRPTPGSLYYVTYEYTRPSSEYDVPYLHTSKESAQAQVGLPSVATAAYNPLALAAEIAFLNGAQIVYTCQVNDSAEGNPTRTEVRNALLGATTVAGATEIVVVGEPGTRLEVVTDMIDHLETECSPTEKHYRRIFCGMASGTAIGDRDTVNSLVGRATRTLQVSANSPARGRMFLVAPPQQSGVSYTVRFESGEEASLAVDATYLATAVAAARTALPSPAETLTRRTITGFNISDITTPWKPAERRLMAGQGVFVITYDAGLFRMLDALSTEGGGGGMEAFKVDSSSYQKDIIVTKVNQALDANIVGIVPFDLASFVLDIKLIIQGVIANEIGKGTIGPFRDRTTGAIRAIDLKTDIRVAQNVNVQTEFNFGYWFNLRYPALRLLGEYSVDNPFFALTA